MRVLYTRMVLSASALMISATGLAEVKPSEHYAPLSFLVGHCWRGTFPDGQTTDEHCFTWIYDGQFVRDRHVLHTAAGAVDGAGESVYLWDAKTGQLQYLYIENEGGYSRGAVSQDGQVLVFPEALFIEGSHEVAVRSRWQRAGADAYDVMTEFRKADGWAPGFKVHMVKVRSDVKD
jgi:hypothetical protein